MKKKFLKHPKLYFNYKIKSSQKVELFYYSNQLDSKGNRLLKIETLNATSFSKKEFIALNKKEYNNLLIYIDRQEKVFNNYFKKNLKVQHQVIKESLSLMYDFKKKFDEFFISFNVKISDKYES